MSSVHARSPVAFVVRLLLYFVVLGALIVAIFNVVPQLLDGDVAANDAGEFSRTFIEALLESSGRPPSLEHDSISNRVAILGVLSFFFFGTIALMLPITWVYMYTHPNSYRRSLITALMILPICATATVWLIQDSLPLAFGLAALVAAVRFRIRLDNPLDGVYIFSAISVGLASGVGHIGVGYVMAVFFSFCATILWLLHYGKRPHDAESGGIATPPTASAASDPQSPPLQAS